MSELTLRLAMIGAETEPDDYTVIHDERLVGRIRLATERAAHGEAWIWNITIPLPMPPDCNGVESTFDAAKMAFKAAWERFYASLTPGQIERWHDTQDTARRNKS